MELQSLGKYRLVAPLQASDTTCRFYLARHGDEPDSEPPSYVVKLLLPSREQQSERAARFQHETQLLESFNHACIPTIHASGNQDGVSFVVMDRVEGTSLADLLGHHGPEPTALPKEIAVYVTGQIADALHHIHGIETMEDTGPELLGVLHRNITPNHILISTTGDAVLAGFGQAKSRWLPSTADDPLVGDLAYMAPERVTGHPASAQTDLFGLAVVLWEMLKGQRCLAGETPAQTRENIERFDIAQSSRRVFGLSAKLSDVVRKNLDRNPERRYTGAYQMLQRLAQSPEARAAETSRAELGLRVQRAMNATASAS